MDPTLRYLDIFHKRYRVPRHRTPSHREQTENQTRESITKHVEYQDSKYANRIIGLTSPGRRTIKIPSRNESIVSDNPKSGKENRSVSVSVRSKQDSAIKAALQHERGMMKDYQRIEQKHPDLLEKFHIYLGDSRSQSRRETPGRTPSAQKHRRLNSSVLNSVQNRAKSNERNSNLISQNNSILNNSQLVEEYLNNSKDNSFANHDGGHYYSVPQSVNVRMEESAYVHDNEKIIDEGDQAENESQESVPTNMALEKGKALFREKNYKDATKFLREALLADPNSIETGYLLGVSYLWLGQHELAIRELSNLLDKQAFYHKNVFVLLSVAYKKTNNPQQGIKILTKAIQKFPKYYDAYITRGKLYLKDKKNDKALLDFNTAIEINPQKAHAFIGKGECYRILGSFDDAVDCFTEAISKDEGVITTALLKRAIAFIELKRFDDALQDLETLISKDPLNSEAYYFKGFLIEKKAAKASQAQSAREDYNEAILCFEQAIKHNTSKKAVIKSLYEITRIKIETRAFYEAYHTLNRAELLVTDQKIFGRYRMFTDGVIYLMKRKFDEGIDNITNVIKKNINDFLRPLTFSYRAYGYFCAGKIAKSLQDYNELSKIQKLDRSASYNKILCEGILAAQEDQFDTALTNFDKALKLYKNKMEPYFYKSVLGIYQFRRTYTKKEKKKLKFILSSSLKELERAIEHNDNNANAYYIKALMLYADGKFNSAHIAIEKAIEKADENYPKYYYLRACIAACSNSYQKAISDCTITINLDKDFSAAYLERGKCYYTLGDIKQAFLDIQKYISIKPEDSNIHLWAGNLLFNTGAFEDAVRAYSNFEQINKCEELLFLRAKCNIILKELNAALSDLNRLVELNNPPNIKYFIDRECLISLKAASTTQKDSDKLEPVHLQQSIQRIAKSLGFKLAGDVFQLHDLYFYKFVFHFYSGELDMALTELDEAWNQREKYTKEKAKLSGSQNFESKEMIKILEDFVTENEEHQVEIPSVFNAREYLYNKSIICIAMQKYHDAIICLQDLISSCAQEIKPRAEELLELVVKEKSILDHNVDLSTVEDEGPAKRIDVTVFPIYNRLCSIFPLIKLPFSAKNIYEARLSFCLPTIYPPSMAPCINEDMIDEINIMSVENRPEAPWIKRNMGGVVFTENFLDREEKEIENLQEILKANNLNPEDLYASIEKSVKDEKENKQDLDEAVIADNTSNAGENNESNTEILKDLKLRRARTGAV